jgi:hypothetical protein
MFLSNVLRGMRHRGKQRRAAASPAQGRHRWCCRPIIEILEDRTLLSTFTVLNTLDSGAGSLRAALAGAQPGDTIRFDHHLSGQTIMLTCGELVIDKSLAIDGLGADRLTVSGNDASRVFRVTSGVTAEIDDLTITHGLADNGGGIWNDGGTWASAM